MQQTKHCCGTHIYIYNRLHKVPRNIPKGRNASTTITTAAAAAATTTTTTTTTLTMNQENSRCALVLFALVLLITGSEAQKSLTSVTPSCGPTRGTAAVTLRGSGFAEGDVAKIGNNLLLGRHTVFESTTELKFLIPREVAKASKNYSLEVVAKDGRTVSNRMNFYIYEFPNLIESISPKVGWQGDTVTVKGNFLNCGATKCRFEAVQMTVEGTFIDNSMLKCKVPVLDQHGVTSSGSSTETRHSLSISINSLPVTNPRNQSLRDSPIKPPPDPDNTFKFMVSCDGQHFDSVPDNIIFTFRDPVKVIAVWDQCAYLGKTARSFNIGPDEHFGPKMSSSGPILNSSGPILNSSGPIIIHRARYY